MSSSLLPGDGKMKWCTAKYKLANRGAVAAVLKSTFHTVSAGGAEGGIRLPDKTPIVSPRERRQIKLF